MTIGFTGTRLGMTNLQRTRLDWLLDVLVRGSRSRGEAVTFHHGADMDGSDGEAEEIAVMHIPRDQVVRHAPKTRTAKDLLARDRDIANVVAILIGAPRTDKEELRSGTWATVRYARQAGIPIVMLPRGKA